MGMITFLLLTMIANGYAKTPKPSFIIGDVAGEEGINCSHFLRPEAEFPYAQKVAGLKKFIIKNDEACALDIVNFMKQIKPQDTQVQLEKIMIGLENFSPAKQLLVKAISKMDFSSTPDSYPILIERMLQIFRENFQTEEISVKEIYSEKIEEFFKLRKEVAQTVAILSEKYPAFMMDYVSEIESGFKHPVYLDSNGNNVIDTAPYIREIEMFLNAALEKLKK